MTRIKLIRVQDAHTRLQAGDTGTIVGESFDQIGHERFVRLDVQWDSGSNLAIYPHLDEFEVITASSVGSSVSQ